MSVTTNRDPIKAAGSADGTPGVLLGRPDVSTPHEVTPGRDKEVERITDVIVGKPTVAANAGTDLNRKLLRAFDAADLSHAEWLRLPSPRARCRLTGLSRTSLNELAERGVIRAVTVRQPGALRGIKLLNRASLLAYLQRLEVEQCGDAGAKGGQP